MHSSSLLSMEENANKVLEWAIKMKYKILYLTKMVFIKDSDLIKNRGRCHLLLVPDDYVISSKLKTIKQRSIQHLSLLSIYIDSCSYYKLLIQEKQCLKDLRHGIWLII